METDLVKRRARKDGKFGARNALAARVCNRKAAFSYRKAHGKLRRLQKLGEDGLHVYHCPQCGKYHVGHRKPGSGK